MTPRFTLALALTSLAACGTESPSGGGGNQLPDCKSGNCGQEKFRRAVPTRGEVRIGHPTGRAAAKRIASKKAGQIRQAPVGRARPAALEPVSPALLEVDDQVAEIDDVVDELFAELEGAAGTTPEVESDTEHRWRSPDPELAGRDDVLEVTTANGVDFDVAFYIVPTGAGTDGATPVIHGEVKLADDDDVLDFNLDIDLDAYGDADAAFDGTGLIVVAAMPLAGGLAEHWFDYHDVSFGNAPAETSRTTAWAFEEDSGALEYVADFDGNDATIYARWDASGGRYDHHTTFTDPDVGLVDEIATNCWGASGGETFDAWAVIDQDLNFYGELDGEESSCSFGPAEDHPSPGADFADLPERGEWETLELLDWCEASAEC
jgi:hypothetical protein